MENINAEIIKSPKDNQSMIYHDAALNNKQKRKGDYIFGETIGQGAFAKVKIATHIYTQEKVAIKIFDKSIFVDNERDLCRVQKEISILKRLRHKNIIQLYEIMESSTHLYIVMDYCEGKDLFDYIIKRNQLSEKKACKFFQQIVNGVQYLHLQNITHRDLKPENLLLDYKNNIILSDFGLSYVSNKPDILLQTPCGTPSYAPPEMLRGDKYLGNKSDIWSCGIILYTMLCGNLPCVESKEELIYQCFYNKTYDYPNHLSTSVVDLIKKLLKFNPEERIDFDQIKRHPWFNLLRPNLKPGIIVNLHKIPVDECILNKVEMFGYNKEECRNSVLFNKYDHLCAIYYLVLKQYIRKGNKTISDMNSDLFNTYIRNPSNWVCSKLIKDEIYKDYWFDLGKNALLIKNINSIVCLKHNFQKDNFGYISMQKESHNCLLDCNSFNESDTLINNGTHNFKILPQNKTYLKQTTFTSSSKPQKKSKSYYLDSIQNQFNKIELKNNPDTEIHSTINDDELINESNKQSLLLRLKNIISSFNYDIKKIDFFRWNSSNTIIPLIAKQLIKTTIFSKHLINKQNHLYNDELKGNFYKLQKYKELVETIKSTHKTIFPRKILDWNYYTFELFLNDKEDCIFSHSYNKIFLCFIKKIQKCIHKGKQLSFSQKYLTVHPLTRSSDLPIFNFNVSNRKSPFWRLNNNQKEYRLNKFLVSPFYLHKKDHSSTHSKSWKTIYQGKKENSFRLPTCISNYSSSTINNISEDEELVSSDTYKSKQRKIIIERRKEILTFQNNKYDIRPRNKYNYKQKLKDKYLNSPNSHHPQPKEAPLYLHGNNELVSFSKSPSHIYSDIHSKNLKQITITSNQKKQYQLSFPQVNLFLFHNNDNDIQEEYYDSSILDCRCVFQSSRNSILQFLQQYFKQNDFFCNIITEDKIKCYKANNQYEFRLMNFKDAQMTYIRIKKNKGGNNEYINIMHRLINSIPI